jgi:hypothetical protein
MKLFFHRKGAKAQRTQRILLFITVDRDQAQQSISAVNKTVHLL